MIARLLAVTVFLTSRVLAQTAPQNSAVSGIVKDTTGHPLANYSVSTDVNATWVDDTIVPSRETRSVESTTDAQGRYRLSDLPAGEYRILARSAESFLSMVTRRVTVAGRDLDGIDFRIAVDGVISGKVVDENKEPVPGLTVFLVSREYYLGTLGYFFRSTAQTDDRGQYTLSRVTAEHPYLIMADRIEHRLPPHSEVPLDPKLRRRAPIRTWYPNSPAKEGAMTVVLRPGERREGVDIELKKAQAYCAEGVAESPLGPAALEFSVEAQSPSSGSSSNGGMFMAPTGGTTGADGKFRICGLVPGTYRLTVLQRAPNRNQQPPNYATANILVVDRDLRNLKLTAAPALPLAGEVIWDGTPPATPVTDKLSISLRPLLRSYYGGENNSVHAGIPGTFSFPGVLMDDYTVWPFLHVPGLYVKDVAYNGRSILNEPLRIGSAMGDASLRVTVARDGATINATVADKDGNPLSDMTVVAIDASVSSEGMLAARLVPGKTDQAGQYTRQSLPPGKYYVMASSDSLDVTPESIGKLWRARNRFTEVELTPFGKIQVTLKPIRLD